MKEPIKNQDRWIKIISTEGALRGVAIHATSLIAEMARMHELQSDAASALGEAVIGALTIGCYCKAGERVNLNVKSTGGVVKQALVDAHPDGHVRGYVIEQLHVPGQFEATQNFGPWGDGLLSVLRAKTGVGEKPYIGTVPLITGHLAKDLTFYWHQSEQTPSAVGLAVNVTDEGVVTSAGGFLVQAMPGATSEEIRVIDQHIQEISSLAESISKDANPLHLLSQIFQSTAFVVLEEKPLRFECNCSPERVHRALSLVGPEELEDILTRDNQASVTCEFCTKKYTIEAAALREMIKAVKT